MTKYLDIVPPNELDEARKILASATGTATATATTTTK